MPIISESWKLVFESNYTQHHTDRNEIVMMPITALLVYQQARNHQNRQDVCELLCRLLDFGLISWPIGWLNRNPCCMCGWLSIKPLHQTYFWAHFDWLRACFVFTIVNNYLIPSCWCANFLKTIGTHHPWHLRHWETIDIFTGQLTSTFGDRETFVTITIAFRHFQTSKHVLHTTHMTIAK